MGMKLYRVNATPGTALWSGCVAPQLSSLSFVVLGGCGADADNKTLFIELIHLDTFGRRDGAGRRSAFGLSLGRHRCILNYPLIRLRGLNASFGIIGFLMVLVR